MFPRVVFIVTNLARDNRTVVRFYNKRGTAEQWIKEAKQAVAMTRLSCHRFRANDVRLWLSVIAYNLGNLWRRLALPKEIGCCRASGVCASLNRDLKMEIPARCEVEIGEAKRKFRVNSERAWVVGGMIMRALRWRRLAPLGIVLATIIGIVPGVASAACPAGNRTLTFTNK